MAEQQLSAEYRSPKSSQSFSSKLPSLPENHDVKSKTEYLSALRSGIVQMQRDVNAFLTKKMEEEKSAEASKGQINRRSKQRKCTGRKILRRTNKCSAILRLQCHALSNAMLSASLRIHERNIPNTWNLYRYPTSITGHTRGLYQLRHAHNPAAYINPYPSVIITT